MCTRNCCNHPCSCISLWITFLGVSVLILLLDLEYCWKFLDIIGYLDLEQLFVYISINIFLGYIILACVFFVILVKCRASSSCWACIKCLWLLVHFILGIGTIGYVYWMRKKIIDAGAYRAKTTKGILILPYETVFSVCYTKGLYYSIATFIIGIVPFVIFSLVYKDFRKERLAKLNEPKKEEEPSTSRTPADEENANSANDSRPPRNEKAEFISRLMDTQNRKGQQKYGNRFVSNINAPILNR